ncbi:MAG: putative zinc-binding metallopeptidase [Granulosicoccus sp.]
MFQYTSVLKAMKNKHPVKIFKCSYCSEPVYFHNSHCMRCNSSLAFDAATLSMQAQQTPLCLNGLLYNACNWLASDSSANGFCVSCELNRTIPTLSAENNVSLWQKVQREKNTLIYSLLRLGLPVKSQQQEPQTGLAFDFLDAQSAPPDVAVTTGHARGVITLDILEADDAHRETTRQQMGERYRTLLGHFRHESAHYYWDRLVSETSWLSPVRDLFGDDRIDYGDALQQHYQSGAPAKWETDYISAYASSHAWEDWAETWAHYIHIVDTLETSHEIGLVLDPSTGRMQSVQADSILDPYRCARFDTLVEKWMPISVALNMLNRSLGQADAYPFVLSPKIIDKLSLVHDIIRSQRQ